MCKVHVEPPDAVAGPSPLSVLNSAIADWMLGSKLKAFLVQLITASSLLELTSCCNRGRNFPLCVADSNTQNTNSHYRDASESIMAQS